MKTKHSTAVLTFLLLGLVAWVGSVTAQNVTTISGRVTDAEGSRLEGVKIEVEKADLSTTSKKDGSYKIIVADLAEAQLTFSLKEYESVTKPVKLAGKPLQLDVRLASSKVQIRMTDFKKQVYIKGKITGLDPAQYDRYKIVVYVLTDQWYIHPYAVNEAGKGYANIDHQGNWQLQTVWRGYQAFKVAFLLVRKEVFTPGTVSLSPGPPESSLLAAVKCDDRFLIIDAPEGI